jgi:hypothetical protein
MRTDTITSYKNHNFNSGIDVTGDISVTGTVDNRDIHADGLALDGINSRVNVLHATDALRLSGNNISLYKGDGSSETVALPISTASVGISLQGNNTNNPVVLKSTGVISAVRTSVGKYQVDVNGSLDGYLSTGTSFTGIVKVIKGSPILIETYNSALLGELYDLQTGDVLDISIRG